MRSPLHNWLRVSFFNLLLVALIGVTLRYKIVFSIPFIDQKHLLHGHSHFAFAGWITHTLMVLLVHYLSLQKGEIVYRKYRFLLYANLVTAYGMLISFPIQGYALWSISFSTLSIFVSYAFAVVYWKDLNSLPQKNVSQNSFKAAVFFNALSSLGAFALAFMMATKNIHQNFYLASVYFFLHFQYNGWFFFGVLGLIFSRLEQITILQKPLRSIFILFVTACIPAYLLSALWLPMHPVIYWIVVLAAIAQVIAWYRFIQLYRRNRQLFAGCFPLAGRWLLLLAALAFTIKLMLQLGSTIPSLSQLAFGFRPIVIGYLHLVLLGVISISLIGYILSFQLMRVSKWLLPGIKIFVAGIVLNEVLLMLQGVSGLDYLIVPYIDLGLFIAALVLFSGILLMNLPFNNKFSDK
jgi:hypothetical protein